MTPKGPLTPKWPISNIPFEAILDPMYRYIKRPPFPVVEQVIELTTVDLTEADVHQCRAARCRQVGKDVLDRQHV